MRPTGLAEMSVSGTEEVLELAAESGFDPEGLAVAFGVQERLQSIAVYLAHSGDRTCTLYLHGVFEEVPRLRPSARRRCPVARTVDAEGVVTSRLPERGDFSCHYQHKEPVALLLNQALPPYRGLLRLHNGPFLLGQMQQQPVPVNRLGHR